MFKSADITARFRATQCHGVPDMEEEPLPVPKICLEEAVVIPITVKGSDLQKTATRFSGRNCVTEQTGQRKCGGFSNTWQCILKGRNSNRCLQL